MASRSPIVIGSSPPNDFRISSVTPQSVRRKNGSKRSSITTESSSPGLPDTSSFYKTPAVVLNRASQPQQVQVGATTGIAPAVRARNTQLSEADPSVTVKARDSDAQHLTGVLYEEEKESGQLPRPKKIHNVADIVRRNSLEAQHPLPDWIYHDDTVSTRFDELVRRSSVQTKKSNTKNTGLKKMEKPSISLSESEIQAAFNLARECPVKPVTSVKPTKKLRKTTTKKANVSAEKASVKKLRQRVANAVEQLGDTPAKKPRKRLTKSESIILNSDEPNHEEVAETVRSATVIEDRLTGVQATASVIAEELMPVESSEVNEEAPEVFSKTSNTSERVAQQDTHSTHFVQNAAPPHFLDSNAQSAVLDNGKSFLSPVAKNTGQSGPQGISCTTTDKSVYLSPGQPFAPTETCAQTLSLPAIISKFSFTASHSNTTSPKRTSTSEPFTKRRRIQLADASTIAHALRKAPDLPPDLPPVESGRKLKSPRKKPRKKPQTITALATKAYQAVDEVDAESPSISAFFPPPAGQNTPLAVEEATTSAVTLKRVRRPRAKKLDQDFTSRKPKQSRKAKKGKVYAAELEHQAPLLSPNQARVEEYSQGFLFGTSSQLAVDEPPELIREIQLALQESESVPVYQGAIGPERKSHARVDSKSHSTNLSVVPADRDLWHTAARDLEGDVLLSEKPRPVEQLCLAEMGDSTLNMNPAPCANDAVKASSAVDTSTISCAISQSNPISTAHAANNSGQRATMTQERVSVDLCRTAPIASDDGAAFREKTASPILAAATVSGQVAKLCDNQPASDNSWMLLKSDESTPGKLCSSVKPSSIPIRSPTPAIATIPERSVASPHRNRTALQTLDANMSLLAHDSTLKSPMLDLPQELAKAAFSQEKRPRGRPRKNLTAGAHSVDSRAKRPGQPLRKMIDPLGAAKLPSPLFMADSSAQESTATSRWVNIDEISDSESIATPSPPRRRANSTPPTVSQLEFNISAVHARDLKTSAVASSTLTPEDTEWPVALKCLFLRITDLVRSTPPSTALNNPTWHEKILLYDPIVLEDLTTWLNERGLTVPTRRLKPKAKKRGRQPKKASVIEPEYEMYSGELKPWMVQKWCEENSVCCLWREGLRGGVKTKY